MRMGQGGQLDNQDDGTGGTVGQSGWDRGDSWTIRMGQGGQLDNQDGTGGTVGQSRWDRGTVGQSGWDRWTIRMGQRTVGQSG